MDREIKRSLIKRKFSSVDYMTEMEGYHRRANEVLKDALNHFYRFPPQSEDWHSWHQSDWPETWESRALRNLELTQKRIGEAINKYKSGNVPPIRSVSGSVQNVFRNMDVMGWKWWEFIPKDFEREFYENLAKASKIGSNITRELSNHWRHPDSVLNEEITGPIDESELKRYLKPGEPT